MRRPVFLFYWPAAALVVVLLAAGCIPSAAGGPSPSSSGALPPTAPAREPAVAALTAVQTVVKRLRPSEPDLNLQKDESVEVGVLDRVGVEGPGRARLLFPDGLSVEMIRDTQIEVSEVRLQPAGFVLTRIKQLAGHTHAELQAQAKARLILETDIATITAVGDGTEFMVCYAPGQVTCMVTVKGEAEVAAQGQVVTVRTGQATFVAAGKRPEPVVCADISQVNQWLDRMRSGEDAGALGVLVANWEQKPCSGASPGAPIAATAEPLPSAEGMVSIPPGRYTVGVPAADAGHAAAQTVELPGFWIDAFNVTNAQYEAFLKSTGRAAPAPWKDGAYPAGQERRPAEGLSWDDAQVYCSWADKRLPGEAEWEVAARGPGDSPPLYPWGDDPTAGGDASQISPTTTYDAGALPFNRSPFGVYDMAETVWQWVGAPYGPVPAGEKILRGGRHGYLEDMAFRQPSKPDDPRFTRVAGVRCAADRVTGG